MRSVHVRLYAQLGDFLPRRRRGRGFRHALREPSSVKDVLESLGPPHPEIELVLVDGEAVGFERVLRGGERVAAFPHFTSLPLDGLRRASPPRPGDGRFVLDGHLGRLAAHLRLFGFDALHEQVADDAQLARTAAEQDRALLTRDLGLLKRSAVVHGSYVRAVEPREQLVEVLGRFGLFGRLAPFTRCMRCNGPLRAARLEEVADRVPPRVRRDDAEYRECTGCGRVYWRGTHYARLRELVEQVRSHS